MLRKTLIAITAAALPTVAYADAGATSGARILAVIPEVCDIEASVMTVLAGSGSVSGTVFEMCNSGRGFRVMASHRALASGEKVEVSYAGEIRQLDGFGLSDVAQRQGPVVEEVPVTIRSENLAEDIAISFGIAVI